MSKNTKTRIIEAAVSLFGEGGYNGTSVRDICSAAGVNGAAINYHFGDKRGLYRAVLEHLLEESCSLSFEPVSGTAEERLRTLVHKSLDDIFRDRIKGNEKLIFREISEPTEELLELMREPIQQIFGAFLEIVQELCGPGTSTQDARLIVLSIFGQIDYYRMFHRFIPELIGKEASEELTLQVLTDHITEFSLAAISKRRRS